MITGTVRTGIVGSDRVFDICDEETWNAMTEDEQEKALIDSMWDSGVLEVFVNELD